MCFRKWCWPSIDIFGGQLQRNGDWFDNKSKYCKYWIVLFSEGNPCCLVFAIVWNTETTGVTSQFSSDSSRGWISTKKWSELEAQHTESLSQGCSSKTHGNAPSLDCLKGTRLFFVPVNLGVPSIKQQNPYVFPIKSPVGPIQIIQGQDRSEVCHPHRSSCHDLSDCQPIPTLILSPPRH